MSGVLEPCENGDLVGQATAEAVLMRVFRQDRLPHAWILTGPPGIGKATLAFRFARCLLAGAEAGPEVHTPAHVVFRMVAAGGHPDLHVLRRELDRAGKRLRKEITVDQLRAVSDRLRSTAVLGGRRVLIVDTADELNIEAANAFLKLLEEPPRGVVLLLVCQRLGRVPITIRSRCARLRLRPLAEAEVLALLERAAPDTPAEARHAAAAGAAGSPGRALAILHAGWLEAYGTLLGTLGGQPALAGAIASADFLATRSRAQGVDDAMGLLATLVHRLARTAAGRAPELELVEGEGQRLRAMAGPLGLDRTLALWDTVGDFADRIESVNLDPWQAFLPLVQALRPGDAVSTPRG